MEVVESIRGINCNGKNTTKKKKKNVNDSPLTVVQLVRASSYTSRLQV